MHGLDVSNFHKMALCLCNNTCANMYYISNCTICNIFKVKFIILHNVTFTILHIVTSTISLISYFLYLKLLSVFVFYLNILYSKIYDIFYIICVKAKTLTTLTIFNKLILYFCFVSRRDKCPVYPSSDAHTNDYSTLVCRKWIKLYKYKI